MQRAVALLATVLVAIAPLACGDDGAEPGASKEATLVLDFQPNAVHAGIYAARAEGYYRDSGIDLEIREPSSSTDSPKLLAAGRAQFAILDIHDLAIAYSRGLDVTGIVPIVQRPLASVIVADPDQVRRPSDLEGKTVGVTGLPSDDAVLDSVLEAAGAAPSSVDRVTIGFGAVSALAAGKVDAATGFWNAEAVALKRQGITPRVFRVDEYGAPRYPELWLCTTTQLASDQRGFVREVSRATVRGYRFEADHPEQALAALLASVDGLNRADQEAQLRALLAAGAVVPSDAFLVPKKLIPWFRWEVDHGIVERLPRHPGRMFSPL
jgi:NitT/TauT family transport system substrate-binding protein/putative hydroxymethylpyrimidine transport system substrate-binding protein